MSFRFIMMFAAFAVSLPLVAGFLGWLHPALDSFSHFRLHLAALLALVGVLLIFGHAWLHGSTALLLAAGSVMTAYPGAVLPGRAQAAASGSPTYRLLQLNIHPRNRTPEAVFSLIDAYAPDVIMFQEISGSVASFSNRLVSSYPHQLICGDFPDVAIFSRSPLTHPTCRGGSVATASINLDGIPVDVVSLHLSWPWPRSQAAHIGAIKPSLSKIGSDAILTGDFNAVPWSHAARQVRNHAGMTHIENVGATWLFRAWPDALRRFGLPIDQVMTKGVVVVHHARSVGPVGSDHLPILVDFSVSGDGQQHQTSAKQAIEPI